MEAQSPQREASKYFNWLLENNAPDATMEDTLENKSWPE